MEGPNGDTGASSATEGPHPAHAVDVRRKEAGRMRRQRQTHSAPPYGNDTAGLATPGRYFPKGYSSFCISGSPKFSIVTTSTPVSIRFSTCSPLMALTADSTPL
jgi:hypothetical protein